MGVGLRVSMGEENGRDICNIFNNKRKKRQEMTDTFINDIVKLNRHLGKM